MVKPKKKNKTKPAASKTKRGLQMAKPDRDFAKLEDVTPLVDFLEQFRQLADPTAQAPSKLISIKIPIPLLQAFQFKAQRSGIPYQTMIKKLMLAWLETAT